VEQIRHRFNYWRLLVHSLLLIYATVLAYILLGLIFRFNVPVEIFFGLSFALLFFALAQSIYELGIKKASIFLIITCVIGFLAEVLGTATGFPFGKYYYTNFLGAKFLGVPIVVPLVWFVIAYLCFSIVAGNISFPEATVFSESRALVSKIALLGAFGAVAWDFMIDPMFSSYGYWVWTGQFLPLPKLDGIPLTNFVGWFVLVTLMIYVCVSVLDLTAKSKSSLITKKNNFDSVIAYILLLVDGVVANFTLKNYAVIGLGLFAMIAFLVLAEYRPPKLIKLEKAPIGLREK
jgi:uncharacterized membrane protein